MRPVVVVCGPTATGKTDFALKNAKKVGADLISIDSRQAYQDMTIGTGKDLPKNARFYQVEEMTLDHHQYAIGYYLYDSVRLWLYDFASPKSPLSSAIINQAVIHLMSSVIPIDAPIILIGGSGYYLRSLIHPPATSAVPPNQALRNQLNNVPVPNLQQQLQQMDATKWQAMNRSDQHNPHRLIRAIEVASSPIKDPPPQITFTSSWIGLTASKKFLTQRILERVTNRLTVGFDQEVETLLTKYPDFATFQAADTLGYSQWLDYKSGKLTYEQAVEAWLQAEIDYANRQRTWFKKQPNIQWFDIESQNWYAQASSAFERWIAYGRNNPQS
jgi:tRNA dimethylallyltransferase